MKEKILIAEDNPQNMRLIEMTLKTTGYKLLTATNGEEVLDIATRERPDLIILDIQLPRMSGLEVTGRLRQMADLGQVPIIAITAYAMKGDKERVLEAGCDAYVTKPIDIHELPGMVAKILMQRQKASSGFGGGNE